MIKLVVAMSNNHVIGKDNKLIWKQSNDLKRFKELTSGNTCIMGRKTFESIGKPLPNRKNCIISRTHQSIEGCHVYDSLEVALQDNPECFVIGGSTIYEQTINKADEIYLTLVDCVVEGDAFFPQFEGFKIESEEQYTKDDKNQYDYKFIKYTKENNNE